MDEEQPGSKGVFHRLGPGSNRTDDNGQQTKVCFHWQAGRCCRRPCPFRHGDPAASSSSSFNGGGVGAKTLSKRSHSAGGGADEGFSMPKSPNSNNPCGRGEGATDSGFRGVVKKKEKLCSYWVKGHCTYGDKCRYLHSLSVGDGFSLSTTLEGHQKGVTGIALPSGSDKLNTGGKDETMRIWDCQSVQMTHPKLTRGTDLVTTDEGIEQSHDSIEHFEEVDVDAEDLQHPDGGSSYHARKPVQKRRSTKRDYWDAFENYMDKNNRRRAKCKHCEASYACDSNKNGTKNVRNHFYSCKKNPANQVKGTQSQLALDNMGDASMRMKNWTFDAKHVREAVVEMIIRDEMSFRSVEKEGFRNAFLAACPFFTMPSRHAIERDCFQLFVKEREKLKDFFRDSCQTVCVTADCWTSLQNDTYMCVTAHFIDADWNLQKRIINFCLISNHEGDAIGRSIEDCLNYWGLSSKLLTVTVDNATSNDVACVYLKEMAKENGCISEGKYLHMRCMTHIINLIVQDGLKECGKHVNKLRAAVKYVKGSPARLHAFHQLAEKFEVEWKSSLMSDVCTRWNSTYLMLSSALKYKEVFSRMEIPCMEDSHLGPLDSSDWTKIEALVCYLKEFYNLTNCVSSSLYATSNYMIFYMSHTVKVLKKLADSEDSCLRNMANEMKSKCNKYWSSIDKLNMLMFVPVILDPFYKIRGVQIALRMMFGQQDLDFLVKMVRDAAYELFDQYVSRYGTIEGEDVGSVSNSSLLDEDEDSSWLEELKEEVRKGMSDRDELSRSEFDLYLHERSEIEQKDILKWWKLNRPRYPILARMARDVLAIPIITAPFESAFSIGEHLLSEDRSNLSPHMLEALVCTQDWLRARAMKHRVAKEETLDDDNEELEKDCPVDINEGIFFVS